MEEKSRDFKRRRPPSRQATKLMLFSLLASIGLAAVLAYVFLPILLFYEDEPKGPHYELEASLDGPALRIEVATATFPQELGEFEVLLRVDSENHTFGPLPDSIPGLVTFFDRGDVGILDVDDYFLVEVQPDQTYTLLILPLDRSEEEGVGYIKWP